MKRPLTAQERAEIEARYGCRCTIKAVTICKTGAQTPYEETLTTRQKRALAARRRAAVNAGLRSRKNE
jgi:hypothetical protein